MSSEKKEKKLKRERSDHKSKKRIRDTDGQPEEEPKHKRSKSEVPIRAANAGDAHLEPDQTVAAEAPAQNSKARRSEKKKQKKLQPQGGEGNEVVPDGPVTDAAAANGVTDEIALEFADAEVVSNKKNKKNKEKKKHTEEETEEPEDGQDKFESAAVLKEVLSNIHEDEADSNSDKKKRKKEKKEKRRKEKAASTATDIPIVQIEKVVQDDEGDVMDIDASAKPSDQPFGRLPDKPYPFYTQKVSQYLPLYPLGMIDPIDGYADQHLKPLLNHYVPTFEGVLLGYHDVQVGEAPGKGSIIEKSGNADEAMLQSIDEYAVCFGWLTAKLDLFKPSRGAWMEGSVNMQTEGHLGVVCWGMFNASIEAGRLPKGWRWISLLGKANAKSKGKEKTPEEAKLPTPEPAEIVGDDGATQLHTTGYWVNDQGQRVKGTLRFQIKNFEVGVSGDYGYLSIEGTMLEEAAEKQKSAEEMEKLRRWKLRNGASRKEHKRLPDFSMTKFSLEEEQEEESQRAEVWKGSRPASETAE